MDNDVRQGNDPNDAPDPIVGQSLSGPILVFSALMFLALAWAVYDEVVVERPWKAYQRQFARLYDARLKRLAPEQRAAEKGVQAAPEFRKIEEQLKAAETALGPRMKQIDGELSGIRQRLAAIKDPFQDARARIAALTYELDHSGSQKGKNSIRQDIQRVKKGPFRLESASVSFDELERRFNELKGRTWARTWWG
jgi:hypothetical protein